MKGSLTAPTVAFLLFSKMALRTNLPIRPNPLIPKLAYDIII